MSSFAKRRPKFHTNALYKYIDLYLCILILPPSHSPTPTLFHSHHHFPSTNMCKNLILRWEEEFRQVSPAIRLIPARSSGDLRRQGPSSGDTFSNSGDKVNSDMVRRLPRTPPPVVGRPWWAPPYFFELFFKKKGRCPWWTPHHRWRRPWQAPHHDAATGGGASTKDASPSFLKKKKFQKKKEKKQRDFYEFASWFFSLFMKKSYIWTAVNILLKFASFSTLLNIAELSWLHL